jgi:hypothetical protein
MKMDEVKQKFGTMTNLEKGSHCYAEQYMMGKLTKYNCVRDEIINNLKIVFKLSFPISLVTSRIKLINESVLPFYEKFGFRE